MRSLYSEFGELFGANDTRSSSEDNRADSQEGRGIGGGNAFIQQWGWVANIQRVAEEKHTTTDEVEMMSAREFLYWLTYAIAKSNEQQRQQEEWRRKH